MIAALKSWGKARLDLSDAATGMIWSGQALILASICQRQGGSRTLALEHSSRGERRVPRSRLGFGRSLPKTSA